jgi:hypothetical protein
VLAGLSLSAAVIITAIAFHSLEGGAPEMRPPPPSEGAWADEEEFGPGDIRPNVPSVFTAIANADGGI